MNDWVEKFGNDATNLHFEILELLNAKKIPLYMAVCVLEGMLFDILGQMHDNNEQACSVYFDNIQDRLKDFIKMKAVTSKEKNENH